MNVLLVSDFFPPVQGGLEFHVDVLAGELADRGHEVHVATLTKDPRPSHPAVRAHVITAAATRLLPHEDAARPFHPPIPDLQARRAFAALIQSVAPDIVHAHSWLGVSVPHRRGVPFVYTAHDYALACQLRTLLRTDDVLCDGPALVKCMRCGSRRYGWPTSVLLTVGTSAGRRWLRPDAVVAVSEWVRAMLQPHLSVAVETINGLLPVTTDPVPPPDGLPQVPFVMYAGDPGDHKGVGVLFDLWSSLTAPAAPLVVAATKPVQRGLPPGVTVLHLTRAQVLSAWREAAVAVVPSKWHEPFPTVAMEALAAGTPVVASRVGGLVDIVRHGIDGLLVPPNDPVALGAALARLLDDPAERRRMGTAASAGASRFHPSEVVPRIEAVYERLIGPGSTSQPRGA